MLTSAKIIVLSDLHLGAPSSLLSVKAVADRLIEALGRCPDVEHFVLLGDILDLTMARGADAWNQGALFLDSLFRAALGRARIHYVPGNHDHHVWSLLVEQMGIVRRLEDFRRAQARADGVVPVLEPLRLEGCFGPDDRTFVHDMFPPGVRDRLYIAYPFRRLQLGEGRTLLAHHGHYFDPKIMPLAQRVAWQYRGDVARVEECNAPWVEGLWYFASLGRTGLEFLERVLTYYDLLEPLAQALGISWPGMPKRQNTLFERVMGCIARRRATADTGAFVGGLSVKYIKDMVWNLFELNSYVLAVGHTHQKDEYSNGSGTIHIFNTGGWLVERWHETRPAVSPAVLQASDKGIALTEFPVKPSEIEEAAAKARNVSPVR